jgi:hypothetical protein
VYALVRSIRDRSFSRNRNFDEHATVNGARARRVHRFLQGVERDLLAADHVELLTADDGYRLTLSFPSLRMSRMVSLSADDYAILIEDACVAARLTVDDRGG